MRLNPDKGEKIEDKSVNLLTAHTKKWKTEYLGRTLVTVFGVLVIVLTLIILGFLGYKGSGTFVAYGHSIAEFLFSTKWNPGEAGKTGAVGSAVFIVGSLQVSGLALLIATPFSVLMAIFIVEIAPKAGKHLLRSVLEIFVGIPSVVYGWIGLTVLVPFIAALFHLPFGFSVLSAAFVLAVMIFPTITSVSSDAILAVPEEYRDASYALGSTRWQMIWYVKLR